MMEVALVGVALVVAHSMHSESKQVERVRTRAAIEHRESERRMPYLSPSGLTM